MARTGRERVKTGDELSVAQHGVQRNTKADNTIWDRLGRSDGLGGAAVRFGMWATE